MIRLFWCLGVAGLMVAAPGCGKEASTPTADAPPSSTVPGAPAKAAPSDGPAGSAKPQPISGTKVID
jgi:hypothetical protein